MFKKAIIISIVIAVLLTCTSTSGIVTAQPGKHLPMIEGKSPYFVINYNKAANINDIGTYLDGEDIKSLTGNYILGDETITFIYNNISGLGSDKLIEQVKECTAQLVGNISENIDGIFPEYQNVNINAVVERIFVKKVTTISVEKAELLEQMLMNHKDISTSKYFQDATFVPDNDSISKQKESSVSASHQSIGVMATEPKGGKSFSAPWVHSPVNPYKGDRQDRLGLKKRTDGEQYNWLPNKYWVDVFELDSSTHRRQVNIGFEFNSTRLGNLNIDDNETFEAEVSFYNYGYSEKIPNGHAYIYDQQYFAHNIPSEAYPYQDTRYLDNESRKYIGKYNGQNQYRTELEEVSYCIGVADTRQLSSDVKYWCVMQGYPYHYYTESGEIFHPESGRAKLTFQRGYNYISDLLTKQGYPSNGHDEWSSFNEEFEAFIRPLEFKDTTVPRRYELTIGDSDVIIQRKK